MIQELILTECQQIRGGFEDSAVEDCGLARGGFFGFEGVDFEKASSKESSSNSGS